MKQSINNFTLIFCKLGWKCKPMNVFSIYYSYDLTEAKMIHTTHAEIINLFLNMVLTTVFWPFEGQTKT